MMSLRPDGHQYSTLLDAFGRPIQRRDSEESAQRRWERFLPNAKITAAISLLIALGSVFFDYRSASHSERSADADTRGASAAEQELTYSSRDADATEISANVAQKTHADTRLINRLELEPQLDVEAIKTDIKWENELAVGTSYFQISNTGLVEALQVDIQFTFLRFKGDRVKFAGTGSICGGQIPIIRPSTVHQFALTPMCGFALYSPLTDHAN